MEEIKLETLHLSNGKADTVIKERIPVLDKYNLWKSIKMIVVDTTNVKTGGRNWIVIQVHRLFAQKKQEERHIIDCQHHVTVRVDDEIGGNNTSSNIRLSVNLQITTNNSRRITREEEDICETARSRDDM